MFIDLKKKLGVYDRMDKKYNIIYADPPWDYDDKSLDRGGANIHYQTMKTEDICNMDIKKYSADNCILFIWGTWPKLQDCLDVIMSWGFEYKTIGFIWIKKYKKKKYKNFIGMGRWTRSNSEYCLIAKKGKPERFNKGIQQIIETEHNDEQLIEFPVYEHSKKPDIIRDKIVSLCGDFSRIELFARNTFEGWDVFGNEVINDVNIIKDNYIQNKKITIEEFM